MAAEVLAQGGAGVTVYDAMAVGRPQVPDGRARRAQSDPQRAVAGVSGALRQGDAAARACDRCVSAGRLRAMERSAGTADLRRLQRPGVSRKRSRPRRCCGRGCGGWIRWACNSRCATAGPAGTTMDVCRFGRPTDRAPSMPTRPCSRSAARAGRGSGPMAAWVEIARRQGRDDIAAAAGQLRIYRRLVRYLSRSLRRPAAEGRCVVIWRRRRCAAKPSSRAPASKAARSMRCRPICARPSCASGEATLHIALRPDLDDERSGRAAVCAARQANALEFSAQGGAGIAGRDRSAAGDGDRVWCEADIVCRRLRSPL